MANALIKKFNRALFICLGLIHSLNTFAGQSVWSNTLFSSPAAPVTVIAAQDGNITQTRMQGYTSTNCSGGVSTGTAWVSGTFGITSGTHTYYLSTTDGPIVTQGSVNFARMICPNGTTAGSVNFDRFNTTTSNGACTATSGCATGTCSGTGQVTSISSSLTLTCP